MPGNITNMRTNPGDTSAQASTAELPNKPGNITNMRTNTGDTSAQASTAELPNQPGNITNMRTNTGDKSAQASAVVLWRLSLFWDTTCRLWGGYQIFWTAYRSQGEAVQEEWLLHPVNGVNRLSRYVGKQLPIYVAQHPRRFRASYIVEVLRSNTKQNW